MTASNNIQVFYITQSTTQTFRDLYVHNTMLVLVQSGSKQVLSVDNGNLVINAGELLIFPSGTFITIENRILSGSDYTATCISYPDELVDELFPHNDVRDIHTPAICIDSCPAGLASLIKNLDKIISDAEQPNALIQHRLLEPLVWIKSLGIKLSTKYEKTLDCQLRGLISSDPGHKWRSGEVAKKLGCSETTLRRRLSELGKTFTGILIDTRLEQSVTALQSTTKSISQIGLENGFATPSHFTDAFKSRFGFPPTKIRKY